MSAHRWQRREPKRAHLHSFLLFLLLGLLALSNGAFAASLSLAWDSVSGATGYRLSYSTTSGDYSANIDAGSSNSATATGLTEGTRYFFAVQAYNATTTSPYSNEISGVAPTTATEPVASFTANGSTASSMSVIQGQSVTLVDTSSGTVTSRSWNLGDGTTATSATIAKSYSTTGAKTVTLSVTGAGVTRSASKTINVTAATAAPVANFTATPGSGTDSLKVQFTDTSTGSITARSWKFGSVGTSTAQNPTYTFASAGTYDVSLTVTGSGGSNTKSANVTVSPPPIGDGSGPVSSAGLVAAYGFEEASGTQTLDGSGNGNHGTLSNVTRSSQGKFGGALEFSGNSVMTVNDSISLDLTNAMTLSAWVRPTSSASGWQNVIFKERWGGLVYSLNANSDTGQPNSTMRIGRGNRSLTAGSPLQSNDWTHLAATYDGATQRLYVNGTEVGSRAQSGSMAVSTSPLRIGGNTVSGQYFQGHIDEVRIYNRALSQSEIAAVREQPVSQSAQAVQPTSVCATPCSLWDNATTPIVAASTNSWAMEIGLKFRTEVAGQVTGVRFYKGSGNTGTHAGRLWSSSGQLLAQATFTNESATGWQQVNFGTPVSIQPATTYVVSYYAPAGRYAYDREYFASAFIKAPLRALSSSEAGGNGVYRYGGGFPTSSYRSANYWVDVVFKTP